MPKAGFGIVAICLLKRFLDDHSIFLHFAVEAIMTRAFHAMVQKADEQSTSLRMGAYLLAVARVAEATELRGVYP